MQFLINPFGMGYYFFYNDESRGMGYGVWGIIKKGVLKRRSRDYNFSPQIDISWGIHSEMGTILFTCIVSSWKTYKIEMQKYICWKT